MNSDCTAKFAIDIFNPAGTKILTATLHLVFDNNSRELRGIFTSVVVPNGPALPTVITASGKRLLSDN